MILNFKDKRTEAVWTGAIGKGFPPDLVRTAQRKLAMLNAAVGSMPCGSRRPTGWRP